MHICSVLSPVGPYRGEVQGLHRDGLALHPITPRIRRGKGVFQFSVLSGRFQDHQGLLQVMVNQCLCIRLYQMKGQLCMCNDSYQPALAFYLHTKQLSLETVPLAKSAHSIFPWFQTESHALGSKKKIYEDIMSIFAGSSNLVTYILYIYISMARD